MNSELVQRLDQLRRFNEWERAQLPSRDDAHRIGEAADLYRQLHPEDADSMGRLHSKILGLRRLREALRRIPHIP